VVDAGALDRLPVPFLIPSGGADHAQRSPAPGASLERRHPVGGFNEDPLSTAVLAIMAVELRVPKSSAIREGSA